MSIQKFLKLEVAGGIFLLAATMLAIILANSKWANFYFKLFEAPLPLFMMSWPLKVWINDGLMSVFFFVIGLELKKEFTKGELSSWDKIALPGIAAAGGMLAPAVLYLLINHPHSTMRGWPIPVATDIAFALGVLSLFGKKIPGSLKIFLMALAIFDDLGAILIIAFYYVQKINFYALATAAIAILGLMGLNFYKVKSLKVYVSFGIILWLGLLNSGVHPTIGGVILAFFIPFSKLGILEKKLHPFSSFVIMPLFAFANAGVAMADIDLFSIFDQMTVGIIVGLVIGKQLGVFGSVLCTIKFGWAKLPHLTTWLQMYAVSLLCGIGFTMSLFLGTLAFQESASIYITKMRFAVLLGSTVSGLLGAIVLYLAQRLKKES